MLQTLGVDGRLLPLLAVLLCGCSSLPRTATLDEVLPAGERSSLGAWNLGDDNCTGSIQIADGRHFWVTDCRTKFGYGWCEFGLHLVKRTPTEFVNDKHRWSFTLNQDGTLTETRNGDRVGQHAVSPTGICGVRAATSPAR